MSQTAQMELAAQAAFAGGKYLTFLLAGEEYGVEILKVKELIGMMPITPIPQTPPFVKGVLNLRGKVIPVLDLRLKFGMPELAHTEQTCIIVVDVQWVVMGLVVDTVAEVLDVPGADIEPPPTFGSAIRTDFLTGIGKVKGKVKLLLNIDKVLSADELVLVGQVGK